MVTVLAHLIGRWQIQAQQIEPHISIRCLASCPLHMFITFNVSADSSREAVRFLTIGLDVRQCKRLVRTNWEKTIQMMSWSSWTLTAEIQEPT